MNSMSEHQEFIFRSKLPDIDIPNHIPIHTYCFANLPSHHSRPALIDSSTGLVHTHADVALASRKLALGLRLVLGVRPGQVVMLMLHNSPEFVFSFLAASFVGAVVTTVNPLYTASEIQWQVKISEPALIVTHDCHVGKLSDILNSPSGLSIKTLIVESAEFREMATGSDESLHQLEVNVGGDDVAVLPFSSGTTGMPKAVMLSHKNIVTCISQQVDGENPANYTGASDVTLCALPMFHVYSMISVMLLSLRVGSAIVIAQRFQIREMMDMVGRYKLTVLPLVPPILLMIAKSSSADSDLSSVRKVLCGAAPLDRRVESLVAVKFPNAVIAQSYGMTEALVLTASLGLAKIPSKFKQGSCGSVIRNARLKIVDPLTGSSLPRNHKGEICIKGDSVMRGYYKDPEATRRAIDRDGWLHTGDIGYMDDDDELFIVDRLKELIKYKGFHIAPAELEALLIDHPFISDAAVVPMKDEVAGEVPVAFVVRANGSDISEQQVKEYISKLVVPYKRINRVFFTQEIPKAPSGKILRKHLRARI